MSACFLVLELPQDVKMGCRCFGEAARLAGTPSESWLLSKFAGGSRCLEKRDSRTRGRGRTRTDERITKR